MAQVEIINEVKNENPGDWELCFKSVIIIMMMVPPEFQMRRIYLHLSN